jgi:hypothetical protein
MHRSWIDASQHRRSGKTARRDEKQKFDWVSLLSKHGSLLGKFPISGRDRNKDQQWKKWAVSAETQ